MLALHTAGLHVRTMCDDREGRYVMMMMMMMMMMSSRRAYRARIAPAEDSGDDDDDEAPAKLDEPCLFIYLLTRTEPCLC